MWDILRGGLHRVIGESLLFTLLRYICMDSVTVSRDITVPRDSLAQGRDMMEELRDMFCLLYFLSSRYVLLLDVP
jgi:hypothetical protein